MDSIPINMSSFFYDDDYRSETMDTIKKIDKPTRVCLPGYYDTSRNILFDNYYGSRDYYRECLRELINNIINNSNIIEYAMNGTLVHIPGYILAEWIECNKFASEVELSLFENQSDMNSICNALQRDTTIKTLILDIIPNQEPRLLRLFGQSLRDNNGIVNLDIVGYNTPVIIYKQILEVAFSPGSNIKSLALTKIDKYDADIDFANHIATILSSSANNSLTTFTVKNAIGMNENIIPILQGVVNNSSISEFHFLPSDGPRNNGWDNSRTTGRNDAIRHQNDCIQIISKMNNLKVFSFKLENFCHLSARLITSALNGMCCLDLLSIEQSNVEDSNLLYGIFQEMLNRQQYYKLSLECISPKIDLILLLKYFHLESFDCNIGDQTIFEKITEEIPNWRFLKELEVYSRHVFISEAHEDSFATAVAKCITLKKVRLSDDLISEETINMINQLLARNEHLNGIKECPEKVPLNNWPDLLAMADITGMDFSYQCIRKIPDVFISFLCADDN